MAIFAFATLANAQSASLALGSGIGTPGSNVNLNLMLSGGGSQPSAIQWTLQYSPTDIAGVAASIGTEAASAGKSVTCTTTGGSAICVIFGFNQIPIADGTVAQLTFAVAPGTTSTSIAIQVTQMVLSDSAGTGIPVSASGGAITVIQSVMTVASGLSCSPASLSPNGTSTCVVTLNQPASGSGASIALASNNASVSVPVSVMAAAGATTASFVARAGSFTSNGSAQITASLNGSTASASLALAAPSQVSTLNCSPTSLNPGGTSTCVVTLNQPAAGSGASISLSSNSSNVSVPVSVTAAVGATSASFTATASSFTADGSAQITSSLNGGTASASLTLATLSQVSTLSCGPATLNPGGTSTCVATLSKPAPASGASIALNSSNTNVSVPPSVTASAGATTASFTATAGSFTADGSAQITASLNGGSASASLTLATLSQVSTLSCSPASLNPGGKSTCLVVLSKPAPASGASIALSSNNSTISVPASVTATAGATTASFTAAAGSFTIAGSAQITASLNGRSQAFTLALTAGIQLSSVTCNPTSLNAGSSSTCTAKLTGPLSSNATIGLSSSSTIVSVPSWIALASGQTSVQFTATAALTDLDSNPVITASLGSVSQSVKLSVIGLRPTLLTCSPQSITAGASTKCTVQLDRAPGTRQVTMRLTSSSTSVQVPQSLSTKNQQTQYSFTAQTTTFASPGTVALSAAYLSSAATTSISILAPAAPALKAPTKMTTTVGTAVTINAQAEDLSGLNVNLSASSLPSGASFTINDGSVASPARAGVSGEIQWTPTASQVGTYSVKLGASSAVGTTSQNVTIQVASQVPHINAVLNAASLSAKQVCSSGSLAMIQGTALQIPSATSGDPADQTSVTVNGNPAEVTDASVTQITFRCPENSLNQKVALQVSNRFGVSNPATVTVQNAAPGIFTLDGSGTGQGLILVNETSALAALPNASVSSQTAAPGDTIALLMTGLPEGLPATSAAQVTIGQIAAEVLSLTGLSKNPGVQMLTVRVPQSAPVGDNILVQVLSPSTNLKSNKTTIAIELAR